MARVDTEPDDPKTRICLGLSCCARAFIPCALVRVDIYRACVRVSVRASVCASLYI